MKKVFITILSLLLIITFSAPVMADEAPVSDSQTVVQAAPVPDEAAAGAADAVGANADTEGLSTAVKVGLGVAAVIAAGALIYNITDDGDGSGHSGHGD